MKYLAYYKTDKSYAIIRVTREQGKTVDTMKLRDVNTEKEARIIIQRANCK